MRKLLILACLFLSAAAQAAGQAAAQPSPEAMKARDELYAGARAYRDGRFAEAQRHFERALELDPTQKNTQLFIARSIQQQYKAGVQTPENVAKGEEAVAAYERVLANDPLNDDAFKAIVFIYGQMRNEEMVREVLTRRAYDSSAPNEKRAEALVVLASKQWQCSYDITERKEHKETVQQADKLVIKYSKPADPADYMKAQQCAAEGLRLADEAVQLDPSSANAWAYKANLLHESAKLADMEGSAEQKADYERQYAEAQGRHEAAKREAEQKKREAAAAGEAPEAGGRRVSVEMPGVPPPSKPKGAIVPAGVLNGKAVSKPNPAYPAGAKAAGAQGTVTVRILVDEQGRVERAEAVSGHPALRPAAVEAARRARFSPTLVGGKPVKVSGTLTYNFVLGR